jgi:pilus assembly protein CpaB
MRPYVIVLVLLALGVATLTAVLFSRVLSRRQEPAPVAAAVAPPPEAEILVAASDIKVGDVVKDGDLHFIAWPAASLDDRFIRRDQAGEGKGGLVGSVARQPLFAGQPITAQALFRRGEAGVMAGLLSPGMRALSIAVTPTSGVAGFVLPNDHVDVLLDQDVHAASSQAEDQPVRGNVLRFASEAILKDVRVLAVDDRLAKPDSAGNQPGKTVTVEVSPKDAETLVLAGRMGELVLALRSMTADEGKQSRPYIGDIAASSALRAALRPDIIPGASGAVRVNRGGAVTTQNFGF